MARYTCGIELGSSGGKIGFLNIGNGEFEAKAFDYQDVFGDRYPIEGGVIRQEGDVVHVPQRMLLEAVDHLLANAPRELLDETLVFKSDCMQHAQMFTYSFDRGLRTMDPRKSIADNLARYTRRKTIPIWEDRSTTKEVAELDEKLARYGGMVALTANPAEPRFPAAQLLKWSRESPGEYRKTTEIRALSAAVTSILAGQLVDTDTGDGWGTNLNTKNINNPGYEWRITNIIAPELQTKLGRMLHYDTRVGCVSPYIVKRFHGFPEARVLAGTGDNPAYLLGFFLSAGTSWTLNGELPDVAVSNGEDNIFGCKPGRVMSLVCFTNGGRLHREFMDQYAGGSWESYHELGMQAEPWKHLMLPYRYAESVPRRPAGIVREQGLDDKNPAANIRALYDSMVASARIHSGHMQLPDTIWITAGGGKSPLLRQAVADAFGRKTKALLHSEHAAVLGNCMAGAADVLNISYTDAVREFAKELPGAVAEPDKDPARQHRVAEALERYRRLEASAA
jgi:sugar (pentulose or hexulose) kinase